MISGRRRRAPRGLWIGYVLLATASAAPAHGQSWRAGLRLGGSAERLPQELSESRFVSGTSLPDTRTTYALRLRFFGEVSGRPLNRLGLTLGVDTGLVEFSDRGIRLDRRDFVAQLERTWMLGDVTAEVQLGPAGVVAVRAGRLRTRLGEGAVYDAYAFGAVIDIDLDVVELPPFNFTAKVLLPDGTFTALRKKSPLIDLQLSYRLGWASRIKLLGTVFFDTDSDLSDPVRSALFKGLDGRVAARVDQIASDQGIDRDVAAQAVLSWIDRNFAVDTTGILAWTGISGEFGDDRFMVRIAALGAFGNIRVATAPTLADLDTRGITQLEEARDLIIQRYSTSQSVPVTAFFGELESRASLTDTFDIGTFALMLTGDRGLQLQDPNAQLGAFLGLNPLLPRTAVFFSGAFGPDQATPTAFSIAPDSAGLLAAGAHLAAGWDVIFARIDGAVMGALVPSRFTGGQLYGFEVDLSLKIPIFDALGAFFDGGVLFPGDFFEERSPAAQVVVGLQVFAEGT